MTTLPSTYENSFHAQNGEDRWLDAYFGAKRSGFFVEIGAFDGYNLSNTFHFEQLGWHESKVIVRFWIAGVIFALLAISTLKLR